AVLNQVVVAHAHGQAPGRVHPVDRVDGGREIGEGEIDQVAGEQNQVSAQLVGRLDDRRQHPRREETAAVDVADVGDFEAVKIGREIGHRDAHAADAEM